MNMDIMELPVQALIDGYVLDDEQMKYRCIWCKAACEVGLIYPHGELLMDAQRAMQAHMNADHGSAFAMLLSQDKRATGLTDIQKQILQQFYDGVADKDIAQQSGTSPSTIRFQRFNFKEKARQAKMIMAISTLLEHRPKPSEAPIVPPHGGATMIDERYGVTDAESEKIIKNFFISRDPLILKNLSSREKNKLVILRVIAAQFKPDEKYTEKQLNAILKGIYGDFATVRRYLIEYGFMERTSDGSAYWLK